MLNKKTEKRKEEYVKIIEIQQKEKMRRIKRKKQTIKLLKRNEV